MRHEEDLPTYLPGDTIILELQLEHVVNFQTLTAAFKPQGEDDVAAKANPVVVEWHAREGKSPSIVHLTTTVDAKKHSPGEYRLVDVSGTTIGGKPLRAQLPNPPVVLRIEGEPDWPEVIVTHAALD
jgi:hypothetical protein